jgi:hypothetical protein
MQYYDVQLSFHNFKIPPSSTPFLFFHSSSFSFFNLSFSLDLASNASLFLALASAISFCFARASSPFESVDLGGLSREESSSVTGPFSLAHCIIITGMRTYIITKRDLHHCSEFTICYQHYFGKVWLWE